MKSLKFDGAGVVRIGEAEDPVAGPGQVVVKTAVSAICGSEMGGYRGAGSEKGNSGHEAAGTVVAVGEGVANLKVGQRVGLCAIAGCGNCEYCAKGQYTWCGSFKFYGSMHAEKILIAANACHPLPDDVPWDVGVLISGDGLGVAYHTSTKIQADDIQRLAILGMGPIGLGNVLLQTHLGRKVIAVDISPYRLDYAKKLGAAECIDASKADAVEKILELTGGRGADAAIEAAGRPETATQCFAAVRKAGTVVFNGEQGELPLSPSTHFIRRDITAVGSWFYHYSEFTQMLALYREGLAVQDMISHSFAFADANEAFKLFAAGKAAKVILRYE